MGLSWDVYASEGSSGNLSAIGVRIGRNELCPCGSGHKYKRCCLERDTVHRAHRIVSSLPPWLLNSRRRLHQFQRYCWKVFGLPHLLGGYHDRRRQPDIPTGDVVGSLFHAALLRIPSINALEGDLKEPDFQRLIGREATPDVKAFSADVVANVLDKLDLGYAQQALEEPIWKAERNKVFREGSYGGLRCVAIDGWEPFASFSRHCPGCLVRKVKKKSRSGEIEEVKQYYHRYVVAMLVGPILDVVLAIEPVRNMQGRQEAGECDADKDEGELTAAMRLLDRLHETYGTFIDAFIFDGLYPNATVLDKLDELRYGAFIVLKNSNNEPLKDALLLWRGEEPCLSCDDPDSGEHVDFWDAGELETLDTYSGNIRVVRAEVTKAGVEKRTWCFGIVGAKARKVGLRSALRITRARWHIENTAFCQWVKHWNLNHVFRHTANALMAVLLIWSLAFNLLQFFVYRRLKRPRRPTDPTETIRHLVEVMLRDVATLLEPLPWRAYLDPG